MPDIFTDKLIQYSYRDLPCKYYSVANIKWDQRKAIQKDFSLLHSKVPFGYSKLKLANLPKKFADALNFLYLRKWCRLHNIQAYSAHWVQHLRGLEIGFSEGPKSILMFVLDNLYEDNLKYLFNKLINELYVKLLGAVNMA